MRPLVWAMAAVAILCEYGHCQVTECVTISEYRELCHFSDGSVVETFSTPGHYTRIEWTGEKAQQLWVEETITKPRAKHAKDAKAIAAQNVALKARREKGWLDRSARFNKALAQSIEAKKFDVVFICNYIHRECVGDRCFLNTIVPGTFETITFTRPGSGDGSNPNCTREEADDIIHADPQSDPKLVCDKNPQAHGCSDLEVK